MKAEARSPRAERRPSSVIYQETLALTRGKPTQVVERGEAPNQRQVEIWDVPALRFIDTSTHPVRVVRMFCL